MSLNYYDPSSRYRERSKKRARSFFSLMMYAAVFGSAGYFVRQVIHEKSATMESKQLKIVMQENEDLQQQVMELKADLQFSVTSFEQLKRRYDEELPEEGELRTVLDLVKLQLQNGIGADRLAFLIRSSRPPSNCTDAISKRFIVSTPSYKGEKSVVNADDTLAGQEDNFVKVSGEGRSARGESGRAEAWYDASRAITVTFENAEGEVETKQGVLPFQHSVVSGAREFRFSVEQGAQSFARVTYDVCDYP